MEGNFQDNLKLITAIVFIMIILSFLYWSSSISSFALVQCCSDDNLLIKDTVEPEIPEIYMYNVFLYHCVLWVDPSLLSHSITGLVDLTLQQSSLESEADVSCPEKSPCAVVVYWLHDLGVCVVRGHWKQRGLTK